jgi:hypothetical protein
MEIRNANIIFSKNGNGFVTTKITLPVGWVKELGATPEDKEVIIAFNNRKIEIIKREDFNMKKWAVIESDGMDEWMKVYESKEKAIEMAEDSWRRLTESVKKKQTITVGLVNVDSEGEYFEDENGNIDADIYEIALELNYEVELNRYNEEMNKKYEEQQ